MRRLIKIEWGADALPMAEDDMMRLYDSDLTYNGLIDYITDADEITPQPCDASYQVEGTDLIVSGGVDVCGFGSCECRCPLKRAHLYYKPVLELVDENAIPELEAILLKYHWAFVTEEE